MVKEKPRSRLSYFFPQWLVGELANEIASIVMARIPHMPSRCKKKKKQNPIENAIFLDTSAIIDGRIFHVMDLRLLTGTVVVLESVLLELKHIADSQDTVRRERGRSGLEFLDKLGKSKALRLVILPEDEATVAKEVDEKLIAMAKSKKGKIITCDFNLAKKASIQKVVAINMYDVVNSLKVKAVPGESLHIKILHKGKDASQGVGYLDDGTMIVVENGSEAVAKTIDVVVVRIIQTVGGKILFAKKI
ncbi:MAG: PIN domain-containing protein [Patescibacteria group bacterium]